MAVRRSLMVAAEELELEPVGSWTIWEPETADANDASGLDVVYRPTLPAFIIAWVARSRTSAVPGWHLMATAYGLAREMSRSMGLVAVALDPRDEEVAEMWQAEPYGFLKTRVDRQQKPGRPPRLWVPLSF